MKFLTESTDTPHLSGVRREKLLRPNPGVDEYRVYWNEHEIEVEDSSQRTDKPTASPKMVKVLTANYISAENETEPTDEDWLNLLRDFGYTEETINEILG